MRGILGDTWREFVQRKGLILFGILTFVSILIVLASQNLNLQFSTEGADFDTPLRDDLVDSALLGGVSVFLGFLVFVAVLATSGLIPRMIERGRAEYWLSKPVARPTLIGFKILAIWIVYSGVLLIGGVLVVASAAAVHGIFSSGTWFVLLGSIVTFFIWLAIIAFVGVLTGSQASAMIAAFITWFAQWLLSQRDGLFGVVEWPVVEGIADVLYYVLPKTNEIGTLVLDYAGGRDVVTWLPLWSSVLFGLVLTFLTLWRFKQKEF